MNNPAVRSFIAEQELRLLSVREFSPEPVTCFHLLSWPPEPFRTGVDFSRSVPCMFVISTPVPFFWLVNEENKLAEAGMF